MSVGMASQMEALSASWTAPEVQIGQTVWWYADQAMDQKPQAAIVVSIGVRSVALHILYPNSYNFMVRDGVRHVEDPSVKSEDIAENGLWTHTPYHLEFLDLRASVQKLRKGKE